MNANTQNDGLLWMIQAFVMALSGSVTKKLMLLVGVALGALVCFVAFVATNMLVGSLIMIAIVATYVYYSTRNNQRLTNGMALVSGSYVGIIVYFIIGHLVGLIK